MGGVSWYKLVVYILLSANKIEMGGVSRYFSKVLGSGVDLTLLNWVVPKVLNINSPWKKPSARTLQKNPRMRLFCLQLEASCLQWSFSGYNRHFSFFTYSWSFFAYSFSFLTYNWSFFAYSGKVLLMRALTDCKRRSLTVSKKAPTVNKKASPNSFQAPFIDFQETRHKLDMVFDWTTVVTLKPMRNLDKFIQTNLET